MVFFPCEIGGRMTDAFEKVDNKFEELKWYLFPREIQRMLPTLLIGLQKPAVFGCFGIVYGSREQFNKVIKQPNQCEFTIYILHISRFIIIFDLLPSGG